MGGKGKGGGKRRRGKKGGKGTWEDPGSDDDDDDDEQAEPQDHPQTDQGLKDDDEDSADAEKASDSGGENDAETAAFMDSFFASRDARMKAKAAPKKEEAADDGLWDPLAGLAPRKKRKVATSAPGEAAPIGGPSAVAGGSSELAEGEVVCLHGLLKAPQLNGKSGTVVSPKDGATGRYQVLLTDGQVKSLRGENLRPVFTGAVVRLKGLQGAAELNGKIAECGDLDLVSGRYSVNLADGQETQKKVKPDNIELVRRYVSPVQMLSKQRPPFTWGDVLKHTRENSQAEWSEQLEYIRKLGVPLPRLVTAEALAKFAEAKIAGAATLESIEAKQAQVNNDGQLMCRIFAVSTERDVCCPKDLSQKSPAQEKVMRRLGQAAAALIKQDSSLPFYFLLPAHCVKPLPCLRASGACAWPLYMQLCHGLVCMETEHHPHKAWCRVDQLMAGVAFSKPVYVVPESGAIGAGAKPKGEGDGSWLLSDKAKPTVIQPPMDGQVLPGERQLLERLVGEALEGDAKKGGKLTRYVL